MEQEYHSELFDIRRVSENDKELFRKLKAIVDREEDIIYCHLDLPME